MKQIWIRRAKITGFTIYSVAVVALALPLAVLLHIRRFAVGIEAVWARKISDWCERNDIPN